MITNPKTVAVKVIQANYGYGWDDLCEYGIDTAERKRLKNDYKAYVDNEPKYAHRIINRRVPNPKYVPPDLNK